MSRTVDPRHLSEQNDYIWEPQDILEVLCGVQAAVGGPFLPCGHMWVEDQVWRGERRGLYRHWLLFLGTVPGLKWEASALLVRHWGFQRYWS